MDRQLVIRAREGDHDAFARLAAASIGRLNGIARLILHDYALAEDAVQEVARRSLAQPPRAARSRSVRSLAQPDPRPVVPGRPQAGSRRGSSSSVARDTDGPVSDDTQASIAAADQLERGLRLLTIEQRTVLVLAFYLDLSLADAAATLGIPIGTMKSRLNRSLAALRAALDADERRPARTVEQPT